MAVREGCGADGVEAEVKRALILAAAALLVSCASAPPQPAWRAEAQGALERAIAAWLAGDTRVHDAEMARARRALGGTGRADLLARAELVRCAARVASLVFEPCERFEALRADAPVAERAYAEHLAARALTRDDIARLPAAQQAAAAAVAGGDATLASVQAIDDPQARLIATAVLFQAGKASPALIQAATETASAQGWRRPLLGWLKVQTMRAEKAGDARRSAAAAAAYRAGRTGRTGALIEGVRQRAAQSRARATDRSPRPRPARPTGAAASARRAG